jgi:hypothetical protein
MLSTSTCVFWDHPAFNLLLNCRLARTGHTEATRLDSRVISVRGHHRSNVAAILGLVLRIEYVAQVGRGGCLSRHEAGSEDSEGDQRHS